MNIAIEEKKSDGAERHLQVTIPPDVVSAAKQTAARKLASKVTVPGFRPGKAPTGMVIKRFGSAVESEALDALVQDAYREVLERAKLRVASQPHVHDLKSEAGGPVSFELHLEIRPEVTLARTHGFRVTRVERTVTDEQVSEQIEHLREQRASWTPLSERPNEGDLVTVTLATADESGGFAAGREYPIVLGGGQAIPGIEEVIMELAPGESAERTVRWPDDFPDESQRGKSKAVRVTLVDAKRKTLPDLDDGFARELGDFESIEAFRQVVRFDISRAAERESDAEVRQKLLDEIIGANPFDVPPSWVSQLIERYASAYQIPEGERERFDTQFRPTAERQVRRELVIETLAELENLKATEADLDAKVTELAEKGKMSPGQLYASLQKSGRLTELEREITEDRVFAWLLERNTVER
jgi:trigger factor